jgi:hypothetical protein
MLNSKTLQQYSTDQFIDTRTVLEAGTAPMSSWAMHTYHDRNRMDHAVSRLSRQAYQNGNDRTRASVPCPYGPAGPINLVFVFFRCSCRLSRAASFSSAARPLVARPLLLLLLLARPPRCSCRYSCSTRRSCCCSALRVRCSCSATRPA